MLTVLLIVALAVALILLISSTTYIAKTHSLLLAAHDRLSDIEAKLGIDRFNLPGPSTLTRPDITR
jgi:hypothetical protein